MAYSLKDFSRIFLSTDKLHRKVSSTLDALETSRSSLVGMNTILLFSHDGTKVSTANVPGVGPCPFGIIRDTALNKSVAAIEKHGMYGLWGNSIKSQIQTGFDTRFPRTFRLLEKYTEWDTDAARACAAWAFAALGVRTGGHVIFIRFTEDYGGSPVVGFLHYSRLNHRFNLVRKFRKK